MYTAFDINVLVSMVLSYPAFVPAVGAFILLGLWAWAGKTPLIRIGAEVAGTYAVFVVINRFIVLLMAGSSGALYDHAMKLLSNPQLTPWMLLAMAFTAVAVLEEDIPGLAAVTGVLATAACLIFAMVPALGA